MSIYRKYCAKRWSNKTIKRNLSTVTPIDSQLYIHNTDRMALKSLQAIPLFDKICSKLLSLMNEPQRRIIDMSSKIQITEDQLPNIYRMVKSICCKIGIDMPDLYLELDREPNAYTYGTEKFSITINSGLLECLEDDEIYAVLAHECGHIACNHVLYLTIGDFILHGGSYGIEKIGNALSKSFVGGIVTTTIESSLELAYYHWQRCSEISADRIATICCGSAKPVLECMMRLAGGTTHIDSEINRDLFVEQSEKYIELTKENKINKALEFWLTKGCTHPLLAVRAFEIQQFANSDEFKKTLLYSRD
ncbi:MAG: M48 family metallopeptidase [Clostridiales bacterium]|nr:M48 family metallopeptidase [Clostridiales bacterium]